MISNGINLARSSQIETLFSEAQLHTFEIRLYNFTYSPIEPPLPQAQRFGWTILFEQNSSNIPAVTQMKGRNDRVESIYLAVAKMLGVAWSLLTLTIRC